jgi:hypothetical protein
MALCRDKKLKKKICKACCQFKMAHHQSCQENKNGEGKIEEGTA